MKQNPNKKSLHEDMDTLCLLLGRSVWSIQHLEDALSAALAIKNPSANTRAKGDKIRKAVRRLTLGEAISRAKEEKTFGDALQTQLEDFARDRNWLIHRCMRESVDDIGIILNKNELFKRVQDIGYAASAIQQAIEIDMIEFSASKGRGDIRETMKQAYIKWIEDYG